jgi:hypothetical protein
MKTNRIFKQRFELFLASFVRSGREFAGSQIHLGMGTERFEPTIPTNKGTYI